MMVMGLTPENFSKFFLKEFPFPMEVLRISKVWWAIADWRICSASLIGKYSPLPSNSFTSTQYTHLLNQTNVNYLKFTK